MKNKIFEIIRFTADAKRYYPASMEKMSFMGNEYIKYTEIEIPLGKSRYGGTVFDLPKGVEPPEGLRFTAQLDLAEFSPFDKSGLLPKSGQPIIFSDIKNDTGKIIYADISNEELVRHTIEHNDNFWDGVLIDKIFAETETFAERFVEPEDEEDEEYTNEDGLMWVYFEGSEKSKIFGIYTNCQYYQDEIEEIMSSNKVVLLQVGEAGFNTEGVFSVLIDKNDLKNKAFDSCELIWIQS
ncbi:MAG: DUF1963 domain-containing protein [Prevotellaceae bacterium]|jgi:uncharacterized protein YwqG|nr:DUF1963 domain-containing protein [Prevotellaceae bacterium]